MTPEPISPDHELVKMSNVTLLPHIGSSTWEARTAMATLTVNNIIAGLEGKEMPAPVC